MEFEELSDEQIEKTLSAPTKPARKRRKGVVVERTVTGWFRLSHRRGFCTNPECVDPRPSANIDEPTTMVYELAEGVLVCRYCFLEGYESE